MPKGVGIIIDCIGNLINLVFVLGAPCGGFILIGLIGALIRFCTQGVSAPTSHRNDKGT